MLAVGLFPECAQLVNNDFYRISINPVIRPYDEDDLAVDLAYARRSQ